MTIALYDGRAAITEPLRPFNHIGRDEIIAAEDVLRRGPLSGYLGGMRTGGYHVQTLENHFCERFHVKHAIACNSATSGLLLACLACNAHDGRNSVAVPGYTMSATAAAPAFLGSNLVFYDIDDKDFCAKPPPHDVSIVTNLFGHPAQLSVLRRQADVVGAYLIEDNAQGILAKEYGRYAGTIGHIGVFSFNVHKHVHCGEGGMVVTGDDDLADAMRGYRNHGELAGGPVGLNLRMTEIEAAIAMAQMQKVDWIVERVINQAERLTEYACRLFPAVKPPRVREGCRHVYYMWAPRVEKDRKWLVDALNAEGFPIKEGYCAPLNRLPAFQKWYSYTDIADRMEDTELCTFENCGYDFTDKQFKQVEEAFDKVGKEYAKRLHAAA